MRTRKKSTSKIDGDGFITERLGPNKKTRPISSEVALQHPDPTHPVKPGAHSVYLSLGVGYQLCEQTPGVHCIFNHLLSKMCWVPQPRGSLRYHALTHPTLVLTKRPFYVHNGLRKFNYKVHSSPPTFLHWRCFRVPEWKPMVQRSDVRIAPVVFTLWTHLSQACGSCAIYIPVLPSC